MQGDEKAEYKLWGGGWESKNKKSIILMKGAREATDVWVCMQALR